MSKEFLHNRTAILGSLRNCLHGM